MKNKQQVKSVEVTKEAPKKEYETPQAVKIRRQAVAAGHKV